VSIKTLTAEEAVEAVFTHIIARIGCPTNILTDQGASFIAELFKEFLQQWRIKHMVISALHPQANGKVERFNRLLKTCMVMMTNTEQNN